MLSTEFVTDALLESEPRQYQTIHGQQQYSVHLNLVVVFLNKFAKFSASG